MEDSLPARPRLRPVELLPVRENGQNMIVLYDPSRLAEGTISVTSEAALVLFQLMDGEHSLDDLEREFEQIFRQRVPRAQLEQIVAQLDAAHFLDSPGFEEYYRALVNDYRSAPARLSADAASFGDDDGGLGPLVAEMRESTGPGSAPPGGARLVGLIAPHLDYPRGAPCYARAYRLLIGTEPPQRVIILGTNHAGRSTSVVATSKDFQTPLGLTRTDREFIASLARRCDDDLCEHEFDHRAEHSVELQLLILQHLFGAEAFEMVPVLCPDPCGPSGTAPCDGRGVDLQIFGEALEEALRSKDKRTLVIAGADLSHVGRRFGDERDLDAPFLQEVEAGDRALLDAVAMPDPGRFVTSLTERGNDTRVCSAGCIYTLMLAIPDAEPQILHYHQAVDRDSGTCVTCTAAAFWVK